MKEIRCKNCGKLLCKMTGGKYEIKCPRCKEMNRGNANDQ